MRIKGPVCTNTCNLVGGRGLTGTVAAGVKQ